VLLNGLALASGNAYRGGGLMLVIGLELFGVALLATTLVVAGAAH
jgi:hypothetical protein